MSFGNDDPQITATTGGLYEEAKPYIEDIMSEAASLYGSNVGRNYYPGSTVVDYSPESQAAFDMQKAEGMNLTGGSNMYNLAGSAFGGMASGAAGDSYMNRGMGAGMGNAYSGLQPQADYLSSVRSGILTDVMGDVQSQFGGMGRTGTSAGAQQAVGRGFGQAYAPIAQSAAEAERQRELSSRESQFNRQYGASQADISRQQQAKEAMYGRMGAGASGLMGVQDSMDARRARGIAAIGGVGSAYEDLAGRQLQDRMNRYQFEQESPYKRLNAFMAPFTSIGSMQNPTYEYSQPGNGLTSAFGGMQMGSYLGQDMKGYGGMSGSTLGGLLGAGAGYFLR